MMLCQQHAPITITGYITESKAQPSAELCSRQCGETACFSSSTLLLTCSLNYRFLLCLTRRSARPLEGKLYCGCTLICLTPLFLSLGNLFAQYWQSPCAVIEKGPTEQHNGQKRKVR